MSTPTRGLSVVGVNHKTAPVGVRERLSLEGDRGGRVLRNLLDMSGVEEAVVVSTCNRVEVFACGAINGGAQELAGPLLEDTGFSPESAGGFLYTHANREAVRHLFRVASSLDSMVVGEPQILGQIKQQFDVAQGASTVGPILHRAFNKSFSVAKRVRNETGVASRTVSVASTAVGLASRIFESLEGRCVLLIGAGDTGETAARHFQKAGVQEIMVANRTLETAVELARELGGTPIPLERVEQYLPLADLVVGSAGGGQLLDVAAVRRMMRERKHRTVFFIDLAVPRNFDPEINQLDSVYLYDVDDLGSVVEENVGERQREALRAEAIVESEVETFWQWFEGLNVVPTIVELRDRADVIRREELERTLLRMPDISGDDRERVEAMTRAIVNKLLHHPTSVLKNPEAATDEPYLLPSLRKLFGLKGDD